jgi:Flp pilus assembly pilin Flp
VNGETFCGVAGAGKWPPAPGKGKERRPVKGILQRLWREEEAQDLVEYALLLVLIALGAIVAMRSLAVAISNTFNNAATNLGAQS